MPLGSVNAALAQYDANPPSTWGSPASAAACLDAVYYLLGHRPQISADQGSSQTFAQWESVKTTLETKLGVAVPRAGGRSRFVRAAFQQGGIA